MPSATIHDDRADVDSDDVTDDYRVIAPEHIRFPTRQEAVDHAEAGPCDAHRLVADACAGGGASTIAAAACGRRVFGVYAQGACNPRVHVVGAGQHGNVDNGLIVDWLGEADGGFADNYANSVANIPTTWHVQAPERVRYRSTDRCRSMRRRGPCSAQRQGDDSSGSAAVG